MGQDAIAFAAGKIVCGRWKVLSRLGAGGCGSVYKVEDMQRKGYIAALKAEAIVEDDSGVLKLEAAVLKKLADRKNVIRLLQSGKRSKYSFIVMTICGSDLMSLKKKSPEGFSESTILRIGIHALYAIKQGRVDDLWAMLYMLGELYVGLPWNRITVEKEIVKIKEAETDENVFKFMGAMKREKYTFSDKYEWEDDSIFTAKLNTALDYSNREKSSKKALEGYDKEALLYTNIHENNFKEILPVY
ncbi:hypothetical protein ANCCEY_03395 [Ancylostoma ceylanicum]|uniref:Protein kinase domain-containing protein n=1 Tax=Ancylostoma ceylanicum TaxID=53326 RepID=A0A0D6M244_9BILA|nr:hypothetical protein ANCCEY_03395 [Ancylostoma ceylanicum]